jgi:ketosteroid isomerase-like protein
MITISQFDLPTLNAFSRDFEDIFYKGDAAAMAAYYTADARLMAENIEPLVGQPAIESFWKSTCEHAKILHMERKIIVEEVHPSVEISYAFCTLLLHFQTPDGKSVDKVVKDITIWRRQPDGIWSIEVDISSPR